MKYISPKEMLLTAKYLKTKLSYDANSGIFRWIVASALSIKIGDIAGNINSFKKYRYIGIKTKHRTYIYKAHRLAWLYVYGVWPKAQIDHIDGDRLNNRISNLREATNAENQFNRKKSINCSSSYIGVTWDKQHNKWRARITLNYKLHHLGRFETEQEAALAYNKAALERDPNFNKLNDVK